jgi:hypothetical protein
MTLETAACPLIRNNLKIGLQAIKGEHRQAIKIGDPKRLQHSIDLEACLTPVAPGMSRWDYALGWRTAKDADCCCFVEVHPANTSHVDDVIAKKTAIVQWLMSNAYEIIGLVKRSEVSIGHSVWHWIATNASVSIQSNSPQARKLAQAGINRPQRQVALE